MASDVETGDLAAFVSLSVPGLAMGRNGVPVVQPVQIDLEGVPRRVDSAKARELARLLDRAATACDESNAALLPPLEEYVERYRERHGEEASR